MKTKNSNFQSTAYGLFYLLLGAALLLAQSASAQSGIWTNKANGNWGTAVNWLNSVVASGVDATADLASVTWTNGHTTTLNAPFTVGLLKFGSVSNVGNTNYLRSLISSKLPVIQFSLLLPKRASRLCPRTTD